MAAFQIEGTSGTAVYNIASKSSSSKIKCTIQLILQNNDDYLEIGSILIAIQNDQTFEDLINKSKKKIDRKCATKYKITSISYEENDLSIYVRSKQNNNISNILSWPQVDFDDDIIDLFDPSTDIIVFEFKTTTAISSKPNNNNNNNNDEEKYEISVIPNQNEIIMIPTSITMNIRYWDKQFELKQITEKYPNNITVKHFKNDIASKYCQLPYRSEYRPMDCFIHPSKSITNDVEKLAGSLPKVASSTINFYYLSRNSSTVSCQQFNDINCNWTVQRFCDEVAKSLPIIFRNKVLFANKKDVTFQRSSKLSSFNFGKENNKNIFHISGSSSNSYPLQIRINEIDVDEKGNDDVIKILSNNVTLKMDSSATISLVKVDIATKLGIPFETAIIYYKLNDKYIALSDDTILSEIELVNPLNLYLKKCDERIDLTLDLFCNGYQLPDNDEDELLINIFNCNDILNDDVLFITPRWIFNKDSFVKPSQHSQDKESKKKYLGCNDNTSITTVLRLSPSWMPYKCQTRKGIAAFLSCLYVICETNETKEYMATIIGHFRYLFPNFSPAILTLKLLLEKNYAQITPQHKAVLSNACFKLFRRIIPQVVVKNDSKIFEYSYIIFSYILGYGSKDKQLTEKYIKYSLQCPLTSSRIIDPVFIDDDKEKVYSRMNVLKEMKDGDKKNIFPHHEMASLLKTYYKAETVFIWDWKKTKYSKDEFKENDGNIESKLSLSWRDMTKYVGQKGSNKCMKIRPILSLKDTNNSDVALTIDLDGNVCAMMKKQESIMENQVMETSYYN